MGVDKEGVMDAATTAERMDLVQEPQGPGDRALASFTPEVIEAPPRVRLAQFAREAARTCGVQPGVATFSFQGDGPHPSEDLLALLTFSYGTGVLSVERISILLAGDILFRSFVGARGIHPCTIRAFRRMERASLKSSLDTFLATAAGFLEGQPLESPDRELWTRALGIPKGTPELGSLNTPALVQERLNQATWVDRMMLDY